MLLSMYVKFLGKFIRSGSSLLYTGFDVALAGCFCCRCLSTGFTPAALWAYSSQTIVARPSAAEALSQVTPWCLQWGWYIVVISSAVRLSYAALSTGLFCVWQFYIWQCYWTVFSGVWVWVFFFFGLLSAMYIFNRIGKIITFKTRSGGLKF